MTYLMALFFENKVYVEWFVTITIYSHFIFAFSENIHVV